MKKVKGQDEELVKELLEKLGEVCSEMGWSLAIIGGEEDEMVVGLVIGEDDFVQSVLNDGDDFDFEGIAKNKTTH